MKRRILALALAAGLLACSSQEPEPPPPASDAGGAAATAPADSAAPAGEPDSAPAAQAAGGGAAGDAERGRPLYVTYCASCHGPTGAGDGPLAASLDPKPVNHTDGNYMNQLSDAHLFKVIQQGGPAVGKSPLMAAWGGTLDDQQIRDVIAYVRSLAVPPYRP